MRFENILQLTHLILVLAVIMIFFGIRWSKVRVHATTSGGVHA